MSRVWKRFFIKMSKGVGGIAYVLGSMFAGGFIAGWLGYDIEAGILAGAMLFIILPMVAFLLRDLYRDAKQEIEWENRKMMNAIKGSDYDR
jgi:putative effector of murein hydrolase LrgA (UPF0299 family)